MATPDDRGFGPATQNTLRMVLATDDYVATPTAPDDRGPGPATPNTMRVVLADDSPGGTGGGSSDPMTGAEIRDELASLSGDDRLDATAIKNLPAGGGNPVQSVYTVAPAVTTRTVTSDFTADNNADEVQINQAIAALGKAVVGESLGLGAHTLLSSADATTGWAGTGGTLSADTSVKKFGTASVKLTPSGSSIRPDLTLSGLNVDATNYDYLDFWAFVADVGKIWITLTTSNGSRQLMHKVEQTGRWVRCKVPLRNAFASSGTLASVTSIKFVLMGGEETSYLPASYTMNLDAVGFTTRRVLAYPWVHPGSITIAGATYETDYDVDFDTGELTPQPGGAITSSSTISVSYTHGGGLVKLLAGLYSVTATGIQMKSYATLDMEDGVRIRQQTGSWAVANAIIKSANTAVQLRHAEVRGGAIVGYRDGLAANVPVDALRFSNFFGLKLRGIRITDMSGAAVVTQQVGSSLQQRLTVEDVFAERCGTEWVDIPGGTYSTLAANHDQHMGSLNIEYTTHFEITRFKSHDGMGDGTKVKLSSQGRFSQCEIRNPRMGGWFVEESNNIVGNDNVVDGAGSRGVTFDNSCNNCSFMGGTVNNSGREGCWIDNAQSIIFANNIIRGAGLLRSSGGATGNMANYGIRVSGVGAGHPHISSNNIIANNIVDVSSAYCQAAIAIMDDGATIENTVLTGNVTPGTQKTIINLQASTSVPITAAPITVTFVGQMGGTSVIQAGTVAELPYVRGSGAIKSWRLVGDGNTGSIEINVARATYGNFPSFTDIDGSAPPTISSGTKAESSTLTGWTTTLADGDTLRFTVVSASVFTRATLYIYR